MDSYQRILEHTREEWDGRASPRCPSPRRGHEMSTPRSYNSAFSPRLSPRNHSDQENQRQGPAWLSSVLYYQNQKQPGISTPSSSLDAVDVLAGHATPRSTTSESRRIEEVSARLKALKDRVEGLDSDSPIRQTPRPVNDATHRAAIS